MADPTTCKKCGRTGATVKMVSGGELYIGCGCPSEPEPTLADVLAEMKALREVCTRHAELLLALANGGFPVIPKDMLAYIHEGEAVVPKAWTPSCSLRSTTGTRLALCRKVSAQAPDLVYDRATGTMVPRSPLPSAAFGHTQSWPEVLMPESPDTAIPGQPLQKGNA